MLASFPPSSSPLPTLGADGAVFFIPMLYVQKKVTFAFAALDTGGVSLQVSHLTLTLCLLCGLFLGTVPFPRSTHSVRCCPHLFRRVGVEGRRCGNVQVD